MHAIRSPPAPHETVRIAEGRAKEPKGLPQKTKDPKKILYTSLVISHRIQRMDLLPPSFDWFPVLLSLKVATVATIFALVIGVGLGWLIARHSFPGRGLLDAVCMLPLVLPPTVVGYVILVMAGRRSAIGSWLYEHLDYSIIFSWHGAVVASAIVAMPLVMKSASAAFLSVDTSLEAAATTLGQSRFSVFLRITLPLAWPGIVAGTLLAFARAMGEFGASLMVAGSIPNQTETLSMAIYSATQSGDDQLAFTLVLITSVLSVSILAFSNRLLSRR